MHQTKTEWLMSAPVSATNPKADSPLFPYIVKLIRGEHLTAPDAANFFRILTDGRHGSIQIAAALTALTAKGETAEELAGMTKVMREQAIHLRSVPKNAVDIAGTGSSSAKTFNVSTAAAIVAAGAGLPVAKQSNRGVTTAIGSSDVLAELGIKPAADVETAQSALDGIEICFMAAPKFHPSLNRVGMVRRALGIRTCLNLLGAIANPAPVSRMLIGLWHHSLISPVGNALAMLKVDKAWVVQGVDGLDEISISGPTHVMEAIGNKTRTFTLTPEDFGLKKGSTAGLKCHSAKESAAIIRDVLESKRRDEARSLIVMNAAAAILIGGLAKTTLQAARLAEHSIDSGRAQTKLERLAAAGKK
ncbi:MAG: anthranilate phosphoribosyltransferase [Chloracidobacterium sp.]|nr:anthranilate phosphoribosyltransferase [Chloracidobacterium sp.]MCO5333145.1 anthranilate phosphoribosyltransferase [Pyrinomonadaceae bacterium]